jgi:hypothetical protein
MDFLKTFINTSLIIGAITYLAKRIIELFFSNKEKEFKNNLEKENIKLRIRYEKLHTERAIVIKEFYKKMVITYSSFESLMKPLQLAGEPSQEIKAKKGVQDANDMIDYFAQNKIFFEEDLTKDIEDLLKTFNSSWIDFSTSMDLKKSGTKYAKEWRDAWKTISEQSPVIKRKIENRFRKIIGID